MKLRLLYLFLSTMLIMLLLPSIGMEFIFPLDNTITDVQLEVYAQLRVPRVLTAFFAGAGLSLSGMVYQTLFRNPLANPFTLGIASGASCGAACTVILGISGVVLGIPAITIGAFIGSLFATTFLFGFTFIRKSVDKLTLLLAGVSLSFLFSSLLIFFQYLSDQHDSFYIVRWLMGGVEAIGYDSLCSFLPFEIVAIVIIFSQLTQLDHLLTGDDIAQSRGVDVKKNRRLLLLSTTILVGTIVAVCGPIGFIGLIVPHICRTLFSWKHKWVAPATILAGGLLLAIADTIARTIIAPTEIPVGVITAMVGVPFFLWILFSTTKSGAAYDL